MADPINGDATDICAAAVHCDGATVTCGHARYKHHEETMRMDAWCSECFMTPLRGKWRHGFVSGAVSENVNILTQMDANA